MRPHPRPEPTHFFSNAQALTDSQQPNRRRWLQSALGWAAAGTSLLTLGGCGGAAASTDIASLRLVNATVDFSSATLKVDGDTAFSEVANGGTATDYVEIASGSRALALYSASGTSGPSSAFTFTTGTYHSLVAYGTLSAGMAFKRLEESTATPDSGTVSLRLLHAAPLLDALDLYLTAVDDELSGLDPTATINTLGALGSFTSVDAGDYRVRLTVSGDHSTVLFDSGSTSRSLITFPEQVVVTLAVVPRSSGSLPDITALPEQLAAGVLSNSLA